MRLSVSEAVDMLENQPMKASEAERIAISIDLADKYTELMQPLRFAKIFSEMLSRVSCPVKKYDLIGGRVVHRELDEQEENQFLQYLKSEKNLSSVILDSGHRSCSWDMLINKGISGLKKEVSSKITDGMDEEKRDFYLAILQIYDAIEAFGKRFAENARKVGNDILAELLENSVTRAPETFLEGLQLHWLITMINCCFISYNPTVTLGRMDKILYPLYEADIKRGVLSKALAKEYIIDYYSKHNMIMGRGEHQIGDETNSTTFDRILNFDSPQYLLIAGTDEDGKPYVNELTELFVEAIDHRFKNPVIVVRYFKNMNTLYPKLWDMLMEKALLSSSMMFYNDDNVLATYKRMGVCDSDARKYEHFGCNWPSLGPDSNWANGGPRAKSFNAYESEEERERSNKPFMRVFSPHGWPEVFMEIYSEIIKSGKNPDINDFYEKLSEAFVQYARYKLDYVLCDVTIRKRHPSRALIFFDAFNELSIQNGCCISACAKYFFQMHPLQTIGTLTDCFTVVDKLVFIDKKLTLEQLYEATVHNFVGYEKILALCNGVDKYGSDTELSNSHAARLSRMFSDIAINETKPYLENYGICLLPSLQSDTWHIRYGQDFGATPNGRLAYTSYSQNARPSNGACTNGLTGMLNSMLSVPYDGFLSGALNLDVNPKDFAGDKGAKIFGSILATYFNKGGLHAQVSSACVEDLIDAQVHPQNHKDLRVRVTGYSGIFVDICENLQNDIIERMK